MHPPEGAGPSTTSGRDARPSGASGETGAADETGAVPAGSSGTPRTPGTVGAAAAGHDPALVATEESSRAYVAPQALPKVALPQTPEPEAKVVLNLPADPVAAVSEEEVRAARARRRTATVKIERATVQETLKAADLATAAANLAAEEAAVPSSPPPPLGTPPPPIVAQARPISPVPRAAVDPQRTPLRGFEHPMPPAVASVREPEAEADLPLPKKSYGRIVGAVLVAAIAGAAFYVTQNGLPGAAAPSGASPTQESAPPATAAVQAPAAPETATPPPPEPAPMDTAGRDPTAHPVTAPVTSARPTAAPRVPATAASTAPRPPRPAPVVPKPAPKPKTDIPSEI